MAAASAEMGELEFYSMGWRVDCMLTGRLRILDEQLENLWRIIGQELSSSLSQLFFLFPMR